MNPSFVDLRASVDFTDVEDQGRVGMCVAEGVHKAVEVCYERTGVDLKLSPYYLYYYAREMEGFLGGGEGVKYITDAAQVLVAKGCCLEASWPSTNESLHNTQPPTTLDAEAAQYKVLSWKWGSANNVTEIKTWLAKGIPVPITIMVAQDFFNVGEQKDWRKSFWNWRPDDGNPMVGLHCVLIIGYDEPVNRFLVQNSWGPQWGDGGFFGLPYSDYPGGQYIPGALQVAVIDKLQVPFVNAGWEEDLIDAWNRLIDWAETKYALGHDETKTFANYYYRLYAIGYTVIYAGVDTGTRHITKYTAAGGYEDLGTIESWLDKIK